MLWFWGLTMAERQAYIPSVGRVPEKTRKRRGSRVETTHSASQIAWLEAIRRSTRSYRHRRYTGNSGDRTPPIEAAGEFSGRAAARSAADGRSVGHRMREPEATTSSSSNEYFGVSGDPETAPPCSTGSH